MKTVLVPLFETLIDILRSRASLHLEMLAMRQQLAMVADGDRKRLNFRPGKILMSVVYIMSIGERPDRPVGLLSGSEEDPLLLTACAGDRLILFNILR